MFCDLFYFMFLCCLILSDFLCLSSPFLRMQDCNYSWFWCLSPGGWSKGLCRILVGGTGTCPLVDGAGSFGTDRQELVKGCVNMQLLAQDDCRQPDGWGCVPTLLVVCPELTQYWNLQAIVWGRVSGPKRQPPGAPMSMFILRVSATSPCPHSEP